jgi:hypothetical protein
VQLIRWNVDGGICAKVFEISTDLRPIELIKVLKRRQRTLAAGISDGASYEFGPA